MQIPVMEMEHFGLRVPFFLIQTDEKKRKEELFRQTSHLQLFVAGLYGHFFQTPAELLDFGQEYRKKQQLEVDAVTMRAEQLPEADLRLGAMPSDTSHDELMPYAALHFIIMEKQLAPGASQRLNNRASFTTRIPCCLFIKSCTEHLCLTLFMYDTWMPPFTAAE
jgi:hypothetical protein